MHEYFVYILRCRDGSYYTGVTNDDERRLTEHGEGLDPSSYTHSRRPVKLVYLADFQDINEAISWEKKVKRWSRKKKEALIDRCWESLPKLAACKNASSMLGNKVLRMTRYRIRSNVSVILSSVEG